MHSHSLVTSLLNSHVRMAYNSANPPYNPASNGLVERAIQTFKDGLKRLRSGSIKTRLARFLLHYCVTPHSMTGMSPKLIMGRKLRTQLDLLYPDPSTAVQRSQDHHMTDGRNQKSFRLETPFMHETTRKGLRGSQQWW